MIHEDFLSATVVDCFEFAVETERATNSVVYSLKKLTICACLIAACWGHKSHAHHDDFFTRAHVINLAGKQRMLSQKLSKEVLLVAMDVNKLKNISNLAATTSQFQKNQYGLIYGDEFLGLPQTTDPEQLALMQAVNEIWSEFHASIDHALLNKTVDAGVVSLVASGSEVLLDKLEQAVSAYERSAHEVGLNGVNALVKTINLSGRQRMLTQKMSKQCLLIAYGYNAEQTRTKLLKSKTQFETVLNGLLDGDPALGLSLQPTDKIEQQLQQVKSMWLEFAQILDDCQTPQKARNSELLSSLAMLNLPLLHAMNKAVSMYEALAKIHN